VNAVLALVLVVVFLIGNRQLRLFSRIGELETIAREANALIRNPNLPDSEKEQGARRASLRLIRQAGILAGLSALSLVAPALLFIVFIASGIADYNGITTAFLKPSVVLGTAVIAAGFVIWR
jgi:hypothetical protein